MSSLQGDVAKQMESSDIRVNASAIKKIVASAMMAGAAIAAMHSTEAHAQGYNQQREAQVITQGVGRIGETVGQSAGRSQNLGNELGRLLSIGATTVAKAMTGQKVNNGEIGATAGQIIGASAGYLGTKDNRDRAAKTVAIVGGGILGTVIGGRVGNAVDENNPRADDGRRIDRSNNVARPVALTTDDQRAFLQSLANANQYQRSANANPYSSFNGYFGQLMSQARVRLVPSGGNSNPSDVQLENVSYKAMELIKVARQYQASEDNWDNHFLQNTSDQSKNASYWRVAGDLEMLKMKIDEYARVRNAAATMGMNVKSVDMAVNDGVGQLRPITNYNFAVSRVAPGY